MRRQPDDVLLVEQLRLLEEKKDEARKILDRGRESEEVLAHEIANDLAGIRFVIRAAVNRCDSGPWRDELELREREALDLLREVVRPNSERRALGGTGGLFVGELVAS